jgi:hypothetical protein
MAETATSLFGGHSEPPITGILEDLPTQPTLLLMTTVPQIDYLLVERALLGALPLDQLNTAEKDFCQKYKPVFEVGRLAARMSQATTSTPLQSR